MTKFCDLKLLDFVLNEVSKRGGDQTFSHLLLLELGTLKKSNLSVRLPFNKDRPFDVGVKRWRLHLSQMLRRTY